MHDYTKHNQFVLFSYNLVEWTVILVISIVALSAIYFLLKSSTLFTLINVAILVVTFLLVVSFRQATLDVSLPQFEYRTGLRKVAFSMDEINAAEIVEHAKSSDVAYKRWAYAFPGRMNGLFSMSSGRKAFISGTADTYLFIELDTYDFYLAINDEEFFEFANDLVAEKKLKPES